MDYYHKYQKYKRKYNNLKISQIGGEHGQGLKYLLRTCISDEVKFNLMESRVELPYMFEVKADFKDTDIKRPQLNELALNLNINTSKILSEIPDDDYILCIGYGNKILTYCKRDAQLTVSGSLKNSETYDNGVKRELKEETGLELKEGHIVMKKHEHIYGIDIENLELGPSIAADLRKDSDKKIEIVIHGKFDKMKEMVINISDYMATPGSGNNIDKIKYYLLIKNSVAKQCVNVINYINKQIKDQGIRMYPILLCNFATEPVTFFYLGKYKNLSYINGDKNVLYWSQGMYNKLTNEVTDEPIPDYLKKAYEKVKYIPVHKNTSVYNQQEETKRSEQEQLKKERLKKAEEEERIIKFRYILKK